MSTDDRQAEHYQIVFRGLHRPPVGQLGPQPWREWPETLAVVAALTADGQEVRFIGGCVRDALLNLTPHDIDLATPDPPEVVMALLQRAGIKVVPTGLQHGTVTAVIPPRQFEITTLRRDVSTDGRFAEVEWTADWMEDAARRDFTINALSARPSDGAVYDYYGGLDHLAHGRVVFIGRAVDRVNEDYLRILRFFRFYSRFGRPPPDPDALGACMALAPNLEKLSAERIRDELLKILMADDAAEIVQLMRGNRVLETILPEAQDIGRLRQVIFLETRGLAIPGLEPDPLRRLAAVIASPEKVAAITWRLRLSNAETNRLLDMVQAVGRLPPLPATTAEARRALLHRLGPETARDAVLLAWAAERSIDPRLDASGTKARIDFLEEIAAWHSPAFPLKGRDLLDLGLTPGREMGLLLNDLEEWWAERGCQDDFDAVLNEARRRLTPPEVSG